MSDTVRKIYSDKLMHNMCVNTKRDQVLLADHFIEPMTVPQDNYYLFEFMMGKEDRVFEPYYVMHKDCSIYSEAKKKYGKHIIGYRSRLAFINEMLPRFRRIKIVIDSYQVFHHTIPEFTGCSKMSPYVFTVFTQHGVNFFKEKFINSSSFSAFMFDKVLCSNEYEENLFLTRGCFNEKNIIRSGLCRWDYIKPEYGNKTIFMFFTHRRYLGSLEDISTSTYYKTITGIIKRISDDKVLRENGYRLKVALHHSVVDKFGYDMLNNIDIVRDEDIEGLKSTSDILITDYSSMCFEFMLQNKPVLFCRINDMEDCIRYNNRTDLISPYQGKEQYLNNICENIDSVMERLHEYIGNGFTLSNEERSANDEFFYYKNSFRERLYDNLLTLRDAKKDWYHIPADTPIEFSSFSDIQAWGVNPPTRVTRCTTGSETVLAFTADSIKSEIYFDIAAIPNIGELQKIVKLTVFVNEHNAGSFTFTENRTEHISFSVPQSVIGNDGSVRVRIKFGKLLPQNVINPSSSDRKCHGMQLISMMYSDKPIAIKKDDIPILAAGGGLDSAIYDIVAGNMEKAGEKLSFSKDVYVYDASTDISTADLLEMSAFSDNYSYGLLSYCKLLKRMPDESAMEFINKWKHFESYSFQQQMVSRIIYSGEFAENSIRAYNNIYTKAAPAGGAKKPNLFKMALLSIARKQPEPLKILEKKILKAVGIKF
ncbi:MAG: CDP-glycerol glycerophosphotransferase family protein [Huintestinicola sp.]